MTKHNILVLWGLVAALSLQAGEASRLQGPALTEALGQVRLGKNPFASAASSISEVAPQGLRNYVLNKGSDALSSTRNALGSGSSYLWNKGGNVLGSAGNVLSSARSSAGNVLSSAGGYASRAWDWSKGVPGAGVVPRGLGQLGSMGYDYGQKAASAGWQGLKAAPYATWEGLKSAPGAIAGYATSPYIAQNIAQRLPSASFVKDYPTTTNIAAALAAAGAVAGTGYGLYKTSQYATDWYRGPEYTLAAKLFLENPNENVYDKAEKLLALKPFGDNALQNALFEQRILQLSIDAFKLNKQQNEEATKRLIAQVKEELIVAETTEEINDLVQMVQAANFNLKEIDATIKKYQEEYNNLSDKIKAHKNRLSEQNPGYFGWVRGKQ